MPYQAHYEIDTNGTSSPESWNSFNGPTFVTILAKSKIVSKGLF